MFSSIVMFSSIRSVCLAAVSIYFSICHFMACVKETCILSELLFHAEHNSQP